MTRPLLTALAYLVGTVAMAFVAVDAGLLVSMATTPAAGVAIGAVVAIAGGAGVERAVSRLSVLTNPTNDPERRSAR